MCQLRQQLLYADVGTAGRNQAGEQYLEAPSGHGTAERGRGGALGRGI